MPLRKTMFAVLLAATAFGHAAPAPDTLQALFDSRKPEDIQAFVEEAQRRAGLGDAAAQFLLGKAYHVGKGVKTDLDRASALYQAAADQGDWRAMNNLGLIRSGPREDAAGAAALFEKALAHGADDTARVNLRDAQFKLCAKAETAACDAAGAGYAIAWEAAREPEARDLALARAIGSHVTACRMRLAGGVGAAPRPREDATRKACREAVRLAELGAAEENVDAIYARAFVAAEMGEAAEAQAWYERAALVDRADESLRFTRMLMERVRNPGYSDVATAWIRRAAQAGHERARENLAARLEATAYLTFERATVEQAMDELARLYPGRDRGSFHAGRRLAYLDTLAHNARSGPASPLPLGREVCLPETHLVADTPWRVHALAAPEDMRGRFDADSALASGKTDAQRCLVLDDAAERALRDALQRGATPYLSVGDFYAYVLSVGDAEGGIRPLRAAARVRP